MHNHALRLLQHIHPVQSFSLLITWCKNSNNRIQSPCKCYTATAFWIQLHTQLQDTQVSPSKHIIKMLHTCDLFRCDKSKRKQSESRIKWNCPNSTKLNSMSSHAKHIWRKHGSTLTGVWVNRQLSENLRLGEIKIKPKQKERKFISKKNLSVVHNI